MKNEKHNSGKHNKWMLSAHWSVVLVMACLSGQEAARRMRLSDHTLPFIFSTGHDPQDAKHEISDFDNSSLYQKPFTITQLSSEIQRLLT